MIIAGIKQDCTVLTRPPQHTFVSIAVITWLCLLLFFSLSFPCLIHVSQDSALVLQSDRNVTVNARNHMGQLTGQLTVGKSWFSNAVFVNSLNIPKIISLRFVDTIGKILATITQFSGLWISWLKVNSNIGKMQFCTSNSTKRMIPF